MDDYYRLHIVLINNSFCTEGTLILFLKTIHLVPHGFKKPDSISDLNSADNTDVARPPYVSNITAL